jgi:hypothetical protein
MEAEGRNEEAMGQVTTACPILSWRRDEESGEASLEAAGGTPKAAKPALAWFSGGGGLALCAEGGFGQYVSRAPT